MARIYTDEQTEQLKELKLIVAKASCDFDTARNNLRYFNETSINNVFADMDTARSFLEEELYDRASEDCVGSYCCGTDVYTQQFVVLNIMYTAQLSVEYGRHDKTYYYIDRSNFKIETVGEING